MSAVSRPKTTQRTVFSGDGRSNRKTTGGVAVTDNTNMEVKTGEQLIANNNSMSNRVGSFIEGGVKPPKSFIKITDALRGGRVCIKPYIREDLNQVVPNSLDEDLDLGPDQFLTIHSNRKWVS